jgi:hypothetical protein
VERQLLTAGSGQSLLPTRKCNERTQLVCGKVEFCLPTKLRAPSLADRLIGRKGHALNAFGLFAAAGLRESKATHVPRVAAASVPTPFATSLQGDLSERR